MEPAVLATLCYHDLFDYPLKLEEICRFLISRSPLAKTKIKSQLKSLSQQGKVEGKGEFYFLKNRETIVQSRQKKETITGKKLKIAKQAATCLSRLPTIKMIAVTGAVAINNAQKDDDIDFLIITSANRLWLTRPLTVLLLELMGARRRPNEARVANKICLNIFLNENQLSLPQSKRNLFTAHEIVQMKVLWQKGNLYQKFLKANQWLEKFLINWKK